MKRKNFTWSYTIMGNEKAWDLWFDLFHFCSDHLTSKELAEYGENYPDKLPMKKLIERCYPKLIDFTRTMESRLSFQVLGYFLIQFNAHIPDDLKKEIVSNSRWRDDRKLLREKIDISERKYYIYDFKLRILLYKEDRGISVPYETWDQKYREVEGDLYALTELKKITRTSLY